MNTNFCPTCKSPIPADAPGGYCPACILRDADEGLPGGRTAPSLEEVAAAFPQLEVLELIGQGGMGFVYKVRQPSLDRTVALKILSPELGRDPAFAERFAREARVLGKLSHPNIVTVFESGESGGFFYLIMEFVDGVNLRQAMRAGRFTPAQALAVVPGICDALAAAHAQGVWHRDIKPENILLDAQGGVKIVDFGIARIVGDPRRDFTLTLTGAALGSAAYMAPEQHERPHDVDHRADIYSLGVVIYEMLTGELPLGRFPAPSTKAAVDARIDEIVLRTLEKERELRQQSAEEVKTDMTNADAGPPRPLQNRSGPEQKSALGAFLATGLTIGGASVAGAGTYVFIIGDKMRNGHLLMTAGAVFAVVGLLGFVLGGIVLAWFLYSRRRLGILRQSAADVKTVVHGAGASSGAIHGGETENPKPALFPTLLFHALLFALVAAFFFIAVPRVGDLLREMGVPRSQRPKMFLFQETQGVLLFPVLFGIDAGLCALVRRMGGRRGLRVWTGVVSVMLVSTVAAGSFALYLPLQTVIKTFGGPPAEVTTQAAAGNEDQRKEENAGQVAMKEPSSDPPTPQQTVGRNGMALESASPFQTPRPSPPPVTVPTSEAPAHVQVESKEPLELILKMNELANAGNAAEFKRYLPAKMDLSSIPQPNGRESRLTPPSDAEVARHLSAFAGETVGVWNDLPNRTPAHPGRIGPPQAFVAAPLNREFMVAKGPAAALGATEKQYVVEHRRPDGSTAYRAVVFGWGNAGWAFSHAELLPYTANARVEFLPAEGDPRLILSELASGGEIRQVFANGVPQAGRFDLQGGWTGSPEQAVESVNHLLQSIEADLKQAGTAGALKILSPATPPEKPGFFEIPGIQRIHPRTDPEVESDPGTDR